MVAIKTAIFPVGGMGTRFLPITKAIPKEMLPIVDRPLIQYAVEEALSAGIEKLVFVTSSGKDAISNYFDSNYELEQRLQAKGKDDILSSIKHLIPKDVTVCYVRQAEPRGLGDAVLTAQSIVGQEPFAILLADDLMVNPGVSVLAQMTKDFKQNQVPIIAVEKINKQYSDQYGMVKVNDQLKIEAIVEKPKPSQAPSDLAVVGRYILTPDIFDILSTIPLGHGDELQLTDAIAVLIQQRAVTVCPYQGHRYDCGSPQGYCLATRDLAIARGLINGDTIK